MNYRSVADLNKAIKKWIPTLPHDLDLIVGIPRSGMLVAALIALYLNVPFTDVTGLVEGRILATGRRPLAKPKELNKTFLNILVVDDSVNSGKEMQRVKAILEAARLPHKIYYAAVYVAPEGLQNVDFWYEIVDPPRVFEWNLMHHGIIMHSCVDLDGVLCRDPTQEENDDGPKYEHFLKSVPPLVIPTYPIGWIVTARLEKYRHLTEEWLQRHGIRYNELIMLDLPNMKIRQLLGIHAQFKASVYQSVNAALFIESSRKQAIEICKLAKRPVFCFETGEMFNPNFAEFSYTLWSKFLTEARRDPVKALGKAIRYVKKRMKSYKIKARLFLRGRINAI